MKKKLKAAIIGFGSIGKRHLNNLSNLIGKKNIIILTRKKINSKNFKFTNKLNEVVSFNPNLTIIGHITESKQGMHLITRSQEKIKLTAQGWNSLSS